jgi:hypothetical protein
MAVLDIKGAPAVRLAVSPDADGKVASGKALYAYNVAETDVDDRRPINCVATDPATGEVLGGL